MPTNGATTQDRNGTTFQFDRGEGFGRLSADLERMCQAIGEQVREAVSHIDFEAIGQQISASLQDVADEARQAAEQFARDAQRFRPASLHVHMATGKPAQESPARQRPPSQERMTVLTMVAEGKITAEQGAQLLEALGG